MHTPAHHHTASIHRTLARSYLVYFVFSMVGLFLDTLWHVDVFVIENPQVWAMVCFVSGPLIMIWAQYTSRRFKKSAYSDGDSYFHHGPYIYARNPTHFGMLVLVSGYAIIMESPFLFLTTLIGYIISNQFFAHYESLVEHSNDAYAPYRNSVNKIL